MNKTTWGKSCTIGVLFFVLLMSSTWASDPNNIVATPVFTPDGGTYQTDQTVVITCATPGATIRYTIDGSDPNDGILIENGGSIYVDHPLTLKCRAWRAGLESSSVKSAVYQIVVATPVFTPNGGIYETDQTVVITCATPGVVIQYTIDSSDPNDGIVIENGGSVIISVDSPTFLKAKAFKDGWTCSEVKTAMYYHYVGGNGDPNGPYQINSKELLLALAIDSNRYNKCFILTEDIDLNGHIFTTAIIAPDTSTIMNFQGTMFTGTFDGNGHKISNLTINGGKNCYLGLFGSTGSGSVIKNLGVENFSISGGWHVCVGGLVGKNNYGNISNCYSTGTVSSSGIYCGGLAGINGGDINDCYATGDINGDQRVGGLVGYTSYGTISNCYSTCDISGYYLVGGLLGENRGIANTCYSTGTVSGSSYVGGLTGINDGDINDCYATGTISGYYYSGGLVGDNLGSISNSYVANSVQGYIYVGGLLGENRGIVNTCYSTGAVSGTENVGGLIGIEYSATATSSFWDIETSGLTSSAGGTGKTTSQMKTLSTFTSAGWDFATVWDICQGTNYPRLQWQIPLTDWVCPDGVNIEDLDYFAGKWLKNDCTSSNDYCNGVDIDASGKVDLEDWVIFASQWLQEI